jgi:hypothetical protein
MLQTPLVMHWMDFMGKNVLICLEYTIINLEVPDISKGIIREVSLIDR